MDKLDAAIEKAIEARDEALELLRQTDQWDSVANLRYERAKAFLFGLMRARAILIMHAQGVFNEGP